MRQRAWRQDEWSGPELQSLHREELLSRILQRKRSFAETAARRYQVSLGRLLIDSGTPLDTRRAEPIRQAADAFRHAVARRTDSHYIGRLLGVMKAVIAEASRDPELGFLPGPQAEAVASLFLDDLTAAFSEHLQQSLRALRIGSGPGGCPGAADALEPGGLARLVMRFRGDMTPRVRRLNMEMVELYCLMQRALRKELCRRDGQDQDAALAADAECLADESEAVPQLIDAFGRGLLHPVDKYYGIEDCAITRVDRFARQLCGPVLQSLRDYAIGADKYDATNRKFLQSIYKYCTAESGFHKACLSEYFEEQHVLVYLVAYLLHLLQLFQAESRLEAFTNAVDAQLRERHPEEDVSFGAAQRNMLLIAWARFCLDNFGAVRARTRAAEVLRAYLPEAILPAEAACPASEVESS
ncbi:hypothetical protein [Megalodesulfovibrio paquesii]